MIMKIENLQKVGFAVGKAQLLLFPACYVRFVSDSVAGLAICGDLFDNFRSGITEGIYARVSDPANEFRRQFPIDIFKASEETLAMPDLCSFRIECSGRIFEGIPPEEIQIFLLAFGVELLKILLGTESHPCRRDAIPSSDTSSVSPPFAFPTIIAQPTN